MKIAKIFFFINLFLFSFPAYCGNCIPSPLSCPPLNLQQQPIILINNLATPNLIFLLDDSTSMGKPLSQGGSSSKLGTSQNAIISMINEYPYFRYGFELINGKVFNPTATQASQYFWSIPASPFDNFLTRNASLINHIKSLPSTGGSKLSRAALIRIGKYYSGALDMNSSNIMRTSQENFSSMGSYASPILSKCQSNYVIFLTDGQWVSETNPSISHKNLNANLTSGDIDKDKKDLYLSDIARYYHVNNLLPTIQGSNRGNTYGEDAYDASWNQNMRFYAVSIEAAPTLKASQNGWPQEDPFTWDPATRIPYPVTISSPLWTTGGRNKIDDIWHAAFNTNGGFEYASSLPLVISTLRSFFQKINEATKTAETYNATYSGNSVAQNSSSLNTGSMIYQASFNSSTWMGDLYAFPISETGVISKTPIWSANCLLTGGTCTYPSGKNPGKDYTKRVVITCDDCNSPLPPRGVFLPVWTGRSGYKDEMAYKESKNCKNFQAYLSYAPYPVDTSVSIEMQVNSEYSGLLSNYIRGERVNEVQYSNGMFRTRKGLLGDIIDSAPVYVGAPNGNYADNSETAPYSEFKQSNINRQPLVYVGANDGMLHGFSADTGEELLAYMPCNSEIYENISYFSQPFYKHRFFVNATPTVSDAFINRFWYTILASGLGNGGKSIYALNITEPKDFIYPTQTRSIHVLNFSNRDSDDVGYIHGSPIIAKVKKDDKNHQWAIIFGNGYNSSTPTTGSGKAALYILFFTGPLFGGNAMAWVENQSFIKIPVGVGDRNNPNGLSTPYAFDINEDGIIDYVYAGDLQGNMWRFDLTDNTPTNWKNKASLLFTAQKTKSGDQAITAPPVVGAHPLGISRGVMVYFGTGKFLEPSDNNTTAQTTQTFYGIWDKLNTQGAPLVNSKNLLAQKILGTQTTSTGNYRLVSDNKIDWNTQQGWYLDLIDISRSSNEGERQVSVPVLRSDRIIFTTLIPPSNNDPVKNKNCEMSTTGSSWLMELNTSTGGAPPGAIFDTNGTGKFDSSATITVGSNTGFAAGYQSPVGITGSPAIFLAPDGKSEVKVLSGSGLSTVKESTGTSPSSANPTGRRENWIQVH